MSSPWGWACASGGGTVLLFWKPEFVNCAWLQLTQAAAPAWLLLATGAGPRAAWPAPEPSGGQGKVAAEAAVCSQGELPPRPGLGGSTSMVRMVQVSHTQPILLPGHGAVSVSVSPCGRSASCRQWGSLRWPKEQGNRPCLPVAGQKWEQVHSGTGVPGWGCTGDVPFS